MATATAPPPTVPLSSYGFGYGGLRHDLPQHHRYNFDEAITTSTSLPFAEASSSSAPAPSFTKGDMMGIKSRSRSAVGTGGGVGAYRSKSISFPSSYSYSSYSATSVRAAKRAYNTAAATEPAPTEQFQQPGLRGNGRYVRIVEVSPRDGLQNLPPPAVPTEVKRELVERLLAAGVRNVEVGSFVRGDWVPQMADTAQLLPTLPLPSSQDAALTPRPTRSTSPFSGIPTTSDPAPLPPGAEVVHYPVLVPNMRGLDNLLKLESQWKDQGRDEKLTDEIAVFVSATEAFSQANNHAPISKVLGALPDVISKAKSNGLRTRGYVSCVMTCPYSGPTPPAQVVDVVEKLLEMGCYEVSLGDTTGEGNPEAWRALWGEMKARGVDMGAIAAHCHDTFSMALSSILSLLPLGVTTVDSSLAGLGGCPYSPGATGNVPTEDVVYALHKLGYETGIDLDKLVEAGNWLCETLGVRNESRVGRAIWARRKAAEEKAAQGE